MNASPTPHDALDRLLSNSQGYIDDNGFTDRVMQRIPAQSTRRRVDRYFESAAHCCA
mgnify:CR=1 FL=1